MWKHDSPEYSGSSAAYTPSTPRAQAVPPKFCTKCGTKLQPNFKHCPGCGLTVAELDKAKRCGSCRAPVGPSDRHCGQCGASV